jgi:flagellar biosynthesis/type III secretory pathway chaperone
MGGQKLEEQLIENLKEILSTQLRLMGELLALLERETPELLEINLDAMAEINGLKESTTEQINEQTAPLRQAILEIAASSGLPLNATLVEVVTLLGKHRHIEIPRLYQDLNTRAKQVRHVAALNHDIAERSMSMVKTVLSILVQLLEQSITYGASGSFQQWDAEGIIINNDA